MLGIRRMHGSCVAKEDGAILLLGPSGSGKSDLALRLLAFGFELVADDQVLITDGDVSCPAELAGLLEARGIGIVRLPYRGRARLVLIAELGAVTDRLPRPEKHPDLDVPMIRLESREPSAANRLALAFECVMGRVAQLAGGFAA